MKIFMALSISLVSLMTAGCAGNMINRGSSLYNSTANSKLIIIRGDNRVGSMVAMPIYLNNELIAKMKTNYHAEIPLIAGTYKLTIGDGDKTTLYLPQDIEVEIKEKSNVCVGLSDDFETGRASNQISQKPIILESKNCEDSIELTRNIE